MAAATRAVAKVGDATFGSEPQSRLESAPEVFRHEAVDEWVAAAVDVRQQVTVPRMWRKRVRNSAG